MLYTRFERARILGARALQISMGAPGVLDALSTDIDPLLIAVREFQAGSIPLTVQRFPHANR
jgi:DNA-directed RNA polymerase subunit K